MTLTKPDGTVATVSQRCDCAYSVVALPTTGEMVAQAGDVFQFDLSSDNDRATSDWVRLAVCPWVDMRP